jgi:toxoflavin biosynthesis protein ToxD
MSDDSQPTIPPETNSSDATVGERPAIRKLGFAWDWRKSNGHMLLLAAFQQPRRANQEPPLPLDLHTTWEAVLAEPVADAVRRFQVQGVLAPVPPQKRLPALLEDKSVAELKALLQEHNLSTSGPRKELLIERLLTEAGSDLYDLLPKEPLLSCTPYGEKVLLDWVTRSETPGNLRKMGAVATAVLTWLIVDAIAPELIGSYLYDLLTQVDEPAARQLKAYRPERSHHRSTYITPALKMEWVYIPAGYFWMGSDSSDPDADSDEKPRHRLYLPAYYIGKYPVTNQQYDVFVRATGRNAPRGWENGRFPRHKADHPVTYLFWSDAVAFCQWAARLSGLPLRLPTEAEWEKAARGPKGYRYPWGNHWDPRRCNTSESNIRDTTPVTHYPNGVSPYGVWDMCGNVWEWTSSEYRAYPYQPDDGRERMDPSTSACFAWRRLLYGCPGVACGVPPPPQRRLVQPRFSCGVGGSFLSHLWPLIPLDSGTLIRCPLGGPGGASPWRL